MTDSNATECMKPCPHCGCNTPWIEDIEHTQGLRWYVFCHKCGATGGQKRTPAKAIEAWNTRTSETQLLAEMQTRVWIAERQRNEAMAALMDEGIKLPIERTCHIVRNSRKYVLSDGTELFEDGCSECNEYVGDGDNYCSGCGAKVVAR